MNDSINQRQHRTLMRGIPIRPSAVNLGRFPFPPWRALSIMLGAGFHLTVIVIGLHRLDLQELLHGILLTLFPQTPCGFSGWTLLLSKEGPDPHTWGLVSVLLVDIEIVPIAIPILSRRVLEASTLPRLHRGPCCCPGTYNLSPLHRMLEMRG